MPLLYMPLVFRAKLGDVPQELDRWAA